MRVLYRSDVQQQVLALPGADDLHELGVLAHLHRLVDAAKAFAQNGLELGHIVERAHRFRQALRQRNGVGRRVGIGFHFGQRADFVDHAQIAAGQAGGQRDVRVGVGADHTVFHAAVFGIGERHADAHGAVVRTPFHIGRRRGIGDQTAIRVHIRGEQRHDVRNVFLQTADVVQEQLGLATVGVAENVLARFAIDDALVHMHGAAGFARHGLGHEGGEHIVAQRRFAQGAFEKEHLVGQIERIAMQEVDFHLPGADFVNQGVDIEVHRLAIVVNILEQRIELVDRVDAVVLARGFGATRTADGRTQRLVGIVVLGHQIKLQLGCHHRGPALVGVELEHVFQHGARGVIDGLAVLEVAVVNDLRGGVGGPGHDTRRARVGHQIHVTVGIGDQGFEAFILGPVAGDGEADDAFRQTHAAVFGELAARQDLAARHPGQVGHEAFDFGNALGVEPAFKIVEGPLLAVVATHDVIPVCVSRMVPSIACTLNAKGAGAVCSGSERQRVVALARGELPTGVAESGIDRARHGVLRGLPFGMPLHRQHKASVGAVSGLIGIRLDQTVGRMRLRQQIGGEGLDALAVQAVDLPGIRADDAGEHAAGYSLHAVRGAVLPGDIQRVVFTMIIKACGVVHFLQQAAAERDIDFLKPAADAEHRNAARKGGADQRQGRGVARRVGGRLRVAQRLAIVVRLDIRRRAGEHQPVHIPQHRIQRQLGAH